MKNFTNSTTLHKLFLSFVVVLLSFTASFAQTSWKGTTNTDWFTASNWTAGVPSASVDVIIGDRSITNYPVINTITANCKSLTIGGSNTGSLSVNSGLKVAGNASVNNNGTLTQGASTITIIGNWSFSGTYNGSSSSYIVFAGTAQTISGSNAKFSNLTINASTYVTLSANIVVDYNTLCNGTYDPNESPTYSISGNALFTLGSTGTAKVKAAIATTNYQFTVYPVLQAGSTVDYAATTVTQTVYSQFTYDNLRISGSGIKQLSGDYSSWNTSGVDVGNVYVASGTLDLFSYSLSRGASGGTLTVANGAKLRIGGTNSLPTFSTYVFNTTSTVEYYGTTQVVTPSNYGNLTLTGASTASFSIPSGKTVNCGNNFVINGGTFNVSNSTGTSTLNAVGSYSQLGGTVNVSNSTGTGVVNINTDMNISSGTFNVISNASAPNTTVTINGDLNISGAAKFNLQTVSAASTATINVNGNFISTGTSVADVNGTSGVIDFGVGTITNNAININGNFTKSGAGTFGSTSTTAAKGFVFNGTGTQVFNYSGAASAGVQYTVNAGATLQLAAALALPAGKTPACSFTVNGTLDFGINTITATTDPTFLLASTGKLITANTGGINGSVAGKWASQTFSSGGQYEFNSTISNQTFGFTGLTITTPGGILVSNTGGIVSADANVVFGNNANLTVNTNSILNAVSNTFAFGSGGKVFENGKMQTDNTNGFAGANNTTIISSGNPSINLGSTSTIEYNGTKAQTISAINYVNLTSSSTGARTLANSGTIGISGVFLAGSNSYTNTGSTVLFNGVVNQNIPAGFAFNNLTINNIAGVTLLGNASVNGANNALSFTNGKITTNAYKLTLGNNVVVQGAGSTRYVIGNLERDFPKSNLTFSYDVGTVNYYNPVTITFANISGNGGTILVSSAETNHPNLSTSGIPTKSNIPLYWTVTNTGNVVFTTYALTLNWNNALDYAGLNTANLKMMQYASSAWTSPTLGGGTNNTKITASTLSTFGDYIVGEPCPNYIPGFSYSSSAFCSSGGVIMPTLNAGGTAGKFTAAPGGLSLDATTGAIDLSASHAGNYTITNTLGTGVCQVTATYSLSVTIAQTATISYDGSPFCNDGGNPVNVHLTGTSGGTFASSSNKLTLDQNLGAVNLATTTPGTYTVTYTIPAVGACSVFSTTASVVLNDIGTWIGGANTDWNNNANWQCGKVPRTTDNITIPSGLLIYPVIVSGKTVAVTNIALQAGATITVSSGGTLQIAGAASTTGGRINTLSGKVEFNGVTLQTVPANLFTSNVVKDLVITNAADVSLAGAVRVTNSVSFGDVNNSVLFSNGYLTLVSTSTNTAYVADVTNKGHNLNNTITGDVTAERYVQGKRAYRFLTTPVKSTGSIRANWMEGVNNTVIGTNINPNPGYGTQITGAGGSANGFDPTKTNNPSMYTFDAVTQTWVALPNTSATFSPGVPYRTMVRGSRNNDLTQNAPAPSATTLRATGALTTGSVTYAGTPGAGTPGTPLLSNMPGGYSFIGNPYASSVDWVSLYNSATNISPSYYIFDPTIAGSNNRGGYVAYNGILKVKDILKSLADSGIQSGQAIFIQTIAPNPTVTFKESFKTTEFLPLFRTVARPEVTFELLLPGQDSSTSIADGAGVYFSDEYDNAITGDDSYKFNNQDENLAIVRDGTPLSLEGRKPVTGVDSIPLKIWQLSQKGYSLKISIANFSANVEAHLEDKFLKTTNPLSNDGETVVPFTITSDPASSAPNRFTVVFETFSTLPIKISSMKAYQKNKGIQIDWTAESESNMDVYEVERGTDAQHFEKIGSVKAKNNAGIASAYNFFDANPVIGDNFYRIKAIEKTGDTKLSEVVKVQITDARVTISVTNNPVEGSTIKLLFNNAEKGDYSVSLMNSLGEKVYTGKISYSGGTSYGEVNLNTHLPAGVYQMQINNSTYKKAIQILIK